MPLSSCIMHFSICLQKPFHRFRYFCLIQTNSRIFCISSEWSLLFFHSMIFSLPYSKRHNPFPNHAFFKFNYSIIIPGCPPKLLHPLPSPIPLLIPACGSLHLAVNTRDWTCTSKISAMLGTQSKVPFKNTFWHFKWH